MEGKFTLEKFAEKKGIKKTSAINLLSKLKKENKVIVSGGGKQKRIYTINNLPKKKTNGFYDIINKYSKTKLVPKFEHYVEGNYKIENAIIDGIKIGDSRTLEATKDLFNHVKNWKRLFDLGKKHNLLSDIRKLYEDAKNTRKVRKIPRRYND